MNGTYLGNILFYLEYFSVKRLLLELRNIFLLILYIDITLKGFNTLSLTTQKSNMFHLNVN